MRLINRLSVFNVTANMAGEGTELVGPAATALAAGFGAAHLVALGLMTVALAVVWRMRLGGLPGSRQPDP